MATWNLQKSNLQALLLHPLLSNPLPHYLLHLPRPNKPCLPQKLQSSSIRCMVISLSVRCSCSSRTSRPYSYSSLDISCRSTESRYRESRWNSRYLSVRFCSFGSSTSFSCFLWSQSARNPSSRGTHQDVCAGETRLPRHYPSRFDKIRRIYFGCPHSLWQYARPMEGMFSQRFIK